jgi:hypothetical protein
MERVSSTFLSYLEGTGAMPPGTLCQVRHPAGYGGRNYDRGELYESTGAHGEARVMRLGYLVPLPGGVQLAECPQCPECGRRFVDEHFVQMHLGKHEEQRAEAEGAQRAAEAQVRAAEAELEAARKKLDEARRARKRGGGPSGPAAA